MSRRLRVPTPSGCAAWPRGLRPDHAELDGDRAFLCWIDATGSTVRLQIADGRVVALEPESSASVVLGRAVTPLLRAPSLLAWGVSVARLTKAIHRASIEKELALLGARDTAPRERAEAVARVAVAIGVAAPEAEAWLTVADGRAPPLGAPGAPEEDTLLAVMCEAALGAPLDARARLLRAADRESSVDGRALAARLAELLGDHSLAIALGFGAAMRRRRVADLLDVARWCEAARDVAGAHRCLVALRELGGAVEDELAIVDMCFGAGDVVGARREARAIAARAPARGAELRLAEYELYALRTASARAALAAAGDSARSARGRRVSAACDVLDGAYGRAISVLDALLVADPRDAEALLWRAEARARSGDLEGARADLAPGGRFADHPYWHLQRGRVDVSQGRFDSLGWSKAPSFLSLAAALAGAPRVEAAIDDRGALMALLDECLARLGGNRTRRPTELVDGEPRRCFVLVAPRTRSIETQARILDTPWAEVIAEFESQAGDERFAPFARTYRAELLLWEGRYGEALACFEAEWARTRTRWAYIGRGAAHALLGDGARALAAWEEGLTHYRPLTTEATFAYRGEVHWRRGDLGLARADLEHAVAASPTRLGAWIALGLVALEAGDRSGAERANEQARALCPALFAEASEGTALAARLRRAHQALLGNRASSLYTFRSPGGALLVSSPSRVTRLARLAADTPELLVDAVVRRFF